MAKPITTKDRAREFPSALYTLREAAAILRVSTSCLNKWRGSGRGPAFIKFAGRIRYRGDDIAAFIEARRFTSTSAADVAANAASAAP